MCTKHWLMFLILATITSFYYSHAEIKTKLNIKIINATVCPNPVHKMSKYPVISVQSFFRNVGRDKILLDINYNITQNFGPVSLSLRVYQVQQDNKLKIIFKTNEATCKNPMTYQLIRLSRGPIDKNCMVGKGCFWVRDLDINKFGWILTKAAISPGLYIYELEYIYENLCVYCSRLTCQLQPRK